MLVSWSDRRRFWSVVAVSFLSVFRQLACGMLCCAYHLSLQKYAENHFRNSTCGLVLRVRGGETRFCGGQRPCPVGTVQFCKDMEPVSPPLVPLMINL